MSMGEQVLPFSQGFEVLTASFRKVLERSIVRSALSGFRNALKVWMISALIILLLLAVSLFARRKGKPPEGK